MSMADVDQIDYITLSWALIVGSSKEKAVKLFRLRGAAAFREVK